MATKSLFVGNIPHGTSEQQLRQLFDEFGPLGDVRVIEGKGFAFVDVPAENAANAIAALNEKDFNGRALRIDEARPRRERPGGGGRRFGGGDSGGGRRFGGDDSGGGRRFGGDDSGGGRRFGDDSGGRRFGGDGGRRFGDAGGRRQSGGRRGGRDRDRGRDRNSDW